MISSAHRRALLVTLATTVALATLQACGGREEAPARLHLSATLNQMRIDEEKHILSVSLRNDGPSVYVERVQLVAPPLRTLPPEPVDYEIKKTPRVDLRLPYGTATCAGDTIPEPPPAHAIVWVRGHGQVRLPLPHPNTLLKRLVKQDCGAQIVRRAADVRLGEEWTRVRSGDRDVLRGTVVIERKAPGRITLQDLRGSVILQLRPLKAEGTPVAVLEDGQDRVDVPVQFTAFGCDPHALAESKKTFVFPHWVGVGDLEPHYLSFPLSPELREELQDLIDDTCLKKG